MHIHKKSEVGLVVVLILVIAVFFFGWVINVGQRECRSNSDCASESYCGSDFSCHTFPTIQKTVVQNNFVLPSVIIGIALVIAAVIFRWDKIIPGKNNGKVSQEHEINDDLKMPEDEEYYNSDIKTP